MIIQHAIICYIPVCPMLHSMFSISCLAYRASFEPTVLMLAGRQWTTPALIGLANYASCAMVYPAPSLGGGGWEHKWSGTSHTERGICPTSAFTLGNTVHQHSSWFWRKYLEVLQVVDSLSHDVGTEHPVLQRSELCTQDNCISIENKTVNWSLSSAPDEYIVETKLNAS